MEQSEIEALLAEEGLEQYQVEFAEGGYTLLKDLNSGVTDQDLITDLGVKKVRFRAACCNYIS